jgi:hypothetical protein
MNRIICDRGEFVDALDALRRGHVLVRVGEGSGSCVLDGGIVWTAWRTLLRYELIGEFHNPHGFANASYFRLTERGREFAERALAAWRQRPLHERVWLRLVG